MQIAQHAMELLRNRMGEVVSATIPRLVVASILGGIVGFERELRHKPGGLRTNMFICFGSAMFTVLSARLAGNASESARIASNIITGIGFIGAGAILHERGTVTGLTSAATIFVVAGIGMAAGGGLYGTAVFGTLVMLIVLAFLGKLETIFELKTVAATYEVLGPESDAILEELSRILAEDELSLQDVHSARSNGHSRLVFTVHCLRSENEALNIRLHQSTVFASVQNLASLDRE